MQRLEETESIFVEEYVKETKMENTCEKVSCTKAIRKCFVKKLLKSTRVYRCKFIIYKISNDHFDHW